MLNVRNLLSVFISLLLLSLSARLSFEIPTTGQGIPITGQSLAILIVIYLLPNWYGVLTIALYLILGVLGLPVFADGTSGIDKIVGNSGGYLYGFLLTAIFLTTVFRIRGSQLSFILQFMIIGTLMIMLVGTLHLSSKIGLSQGFQYGFKPFIAGAGIKILAGTALVYLYQLIFHKNSY